MKSGMRRTGIALLTVMVGAMGAFGAATAASAAPVTTDPAAAAPDLTAPATTSTPRPLTDIAMFNLKKRTIREWSPARTERMLVLEHQPTTESGKVFYLFDPKTQKSTGGFSHGDITHPTVNNWKLVQFRIPSTSVEVRYGDIDEPTWGQVVASYTVTRYLANNVRIAKQYNEAGSAITVLKVANQPPVVCGGVFFLYDPTTGRKGVFTVGGDVVQETVDNWDQAEFQLGSGAMEVRFGNPELPEEGFFVARVSVVG